VALPAHDVQAGTPLPPNVMLTTGAPNTLTSHQLGQEADRWSSRLAHLPQPRLAVLIGGDSKHGKLSPHSVQQLVQGALAWATASGGSLLISTSRRTSSRATEVAQRLLSTTQVPHYFHTPTGVDNPYIAFLATAQGVLITQESVSMVSQAATAGKPVYSWGQVSQLPLKLQRFHALLQQQHRLHPWPTNNQPTLRQPKQALNDAASVAGFIHGRWLQHHLT
jgi:mitochondrial fission protein ELM1